MEEWSAKGGREEEEENVGKEVSKGRKFFTAASDICQIGRMLDCVRKGTWSLQFSSFATMLLSKKTHSEGVEVPLDGTRALQHEWITMNN